MAYGLTGQEQARLDAVPWPHKLIVAERLDQERAEAAAEAEQARLDAQHADWMAWVRYTRERAEEETRNHRAGLPCDTRYCRFDCHGPRCCSAADLAHKHVYERP